MRPSISGSRPYSFSGISSRSDVSCAPSGNVSMRPCACHAFRHAPKVGLDARGGLVPILGGLGEQLHDDGRDRLRECPFTRSRGGIGLRAIWQWIHSIGSEAVNGSTPVSISYRVTPNE